MSALRTSESARGRTAKWWVWVLAVAMVVLASPGAWAATTYQAISPFDTIDWDNIGGPGVPFVDGDILQLPANGSGHIEIPTSILSLTIDGQGHALTDTYITTVAAHPGVTLTIKNLNITAPVGTGGGTFGHLVTGSFPAIDLEGASTLVVTGTNTVTGGTESAGVHVGAAQTLTIEGTGTLNANAGAVKDSDPSGAAAIGGNGNKTDGSQVAENCGTITIRGDVTVNATLSGASHAYNIGAGEYASHVLITISGNAVVTAINPGWSNLGGIGSRVPVVGTTTTITGGSVRADSFSPTPTDGTVPVYKVAVKVTLDGAPASGATITTGTGGSYTATTGSDGIAYCYLPEVNPMSVTATKGTLSKTGTVTVKTDNSATLTLALFTPGDPDPSPISVTGVTMSKTALDLETGKTGQLTATVQPSNATNKKVTWSSSDPNIVSVDQTGKVTAVGPGTATITVTTEDGKKTATCTVTVTEAPAPGPQEKALFTINVADCEIVITQNTDGTLAVKVRIPFASGSNPALLDTVKMIASSLGLSDISYVWIDAQGKETPVTRMAASAPYLEIRGTATNMDAIKDGAITKIEYTLKGEDGLYAQTFPGSGLKVADMPGYRNPEPTSSGSSSGCNAGLWGELGIILLLALAPLLWRRDG